jgi:DNA-binding CsgD family transcriptional regulator/PAS domain-containing protein
MYNLSRNDLEEILKFVNFCMTRIKTGNVDPKELLAEMLKIFQSYDAEFFPSNQSSNGVDLSNSFSIKEGKADLVKYVDHYWRYDPLYSAQFSTKPTNQVFKTDDVISYSQLKKLDYYREYLQQINWFGELVIRLCTNEGYWGTISISRSSKQPYFNHTDVQKAEFLLPYLINTFEATMFFSKINGERKAFEQWLESRPEGIILLDTKLQPVFYNNKARQMSRPLSEIKSESLIKYQNADITLPQSIAEDCQRLADSRDSNQSLPNNRIINTKNGDRYYIRYTLINQLCQEILLPYFIIHMNDLTNKTDEPGVVLLKNYGLSEQEEKIAQYTGQGLTNKEIGKKLGISQFTVQSHLRNIFEKTGIKRRSQLANLIK